MGTEQDQPLPGGWPKPQDAITTRLGAISPRRAPRGRQLALPPARRELHVRHRLRHVQNQRGEGVL
eukprot:3166573-Pyramimonas_sp.AAC.1